MNVSSRLINGKLMNFLIFSILDNIFLKIKIKIKTYIHLMQYGKLGSKNQKSLTKCSRIVIINFDVVCKISSYYYVCFQWGF